MRVKAFFKENSNFCFSMKFNNILDDKRDKISFTLFSQKSILKKQKWNVIQLKFQLQYAGGVSMRN